LQGSSSSSLTFSLQRGLNTIKQARLLDGQLSQQPTSVTNKVSMLAVLVQGLLLRRTRYFFPPVVALPRPSPILISAIHGVVLSVWLNNNNTNNTIAFQSKADHPPMRAFS